MTTRRESLLAHGLLLAVVAVWGATFPLVKAALRDCSPLYFNALRMTLAFAVLAVVHWKSWTQMTMRAWISGAVAGGCLAAGYALQTMGLALTTPSKSAFLTGTIVILVPLLCAIPILRPAGMAPAGWRTVPGVLLAFVGIVLLTVPKGGGAGSVNRGDLLSLLCAVAFAMHLLVLARSSNRVPTSQLATLQIGFCALCMVVSAPMAEHRYLHWTGSLVATLVACAVLATAAAFTIQSWAQKHLPATHTALLLSLEPVFAWIVSLAFYGETISTRPTLGSLLMFVGILVTEFTQPVAADGAAAA